MKKIWWYEPYLKCRIRKHRKNEKGEETREILIPDQRSGALIKELNYETQRNKPTGYSRLYRKVSRIPEVLESLSRDIGLMEWVGDAITRFKELKNPLKLLFEGNGLSKLTDLYSNNSDSELTKEAVDNRYSAKKESWSYQNLGNHLYQMVDNFQVSNPLMEKYPAEEGEGTLAGFDWTFGDRRNLLLNNSKYLETWTSLFKEREKAPHIISHPWWKRLREEMKEHLKTIPVNIRNASTLAVEDLLRSEMKLPTELTIRHSLVTRPIVKTELSQEERAKLSKKATRKLEKEFHRELGVWPRNLKRLKPI